MPAPVHLPLEIRPLVDAAPPSVSVSWAFPDVSAEEWQGLSCAGLDPDGRFAPSLGCFLACMPGVTALVDAGIGPAPNAYLGGLQGQLRDRLPRYDILPTDVDLVIFTHLHMDHVGWAGGVAGPFFPNARYVAPASDVAFFAAGAEGMGDHHRAAFDTTLAPLIDRGAIDLLPDGAAIAPGIDYLSTPGHTPGHQSVLIRSASNTTVITGDVFHCPAQVEQPDWSHRADHDPEMARVTRRAFIDLAATETWTVAAGHFRAGLQLGCVETTRTGYRYVPLEAKEQRAATGLRRRSPARRSK